MRSEEIPEPGYGRAVHTTHRYPDISSLLDTERCSVARVGDTAKADYPLWDTFCELHASPPGANSSLQLHPVLPSSGISLYGLNNTFAIIRMRASVQTAVYFLLISVCPSHAHAVCGRLGSGLLPAWLCFSCSRATSRHRPAG